MLLFQNEQWRTYWITGDGSELTFDLVVKGENFDEQSVLSPAARGKLAEANAKYQSRPFPKTMHSRICHSGRSLCRSLHFYSCGSIPSRLRKDADVRQLLLSLSRVGIRRYDAYRHSPTMIAFAPADAALLARNLLRRRHRAALRKCDDPRWRAARRRRDQLAIRSSW